MPNPAPSTTQVVVVGAGIGGLAAALRLAARGISVAVLDMGLAPGGKISTVETAAGPADTGPTVLTMREVFEELFADAGARLSDHVALTPLDPIARHFWPDGRTLDLRADPEGSAQDVEALFGRTAARAFRRHVARAARLYDAFDAPMMRHPSPRPMALAARVMRHPGLLRDMAPHRSLAGRLRAAFPTPHLAQLYARYATYIGGTPARVPALLDLIGHAEARGVWRVDGGLQALPAAIASLAVARGATIHGNTTVTALDPGPGGWTVRTDRGVHLADRVLFNGDPRALREGLLGPAVTTAVPPDATEPRSLSAVVLAFAATARGLRLAHHNVFFSQTPDAEFEALNAGHLPKDFNLYLCAQDAHLAQSDPGRATTQVPGRFEVILNAPPGLSLTAQDKETCLTRILTRFASYDLTFDPPPTVADMRVPQDWEALSPGSQGALYGRSPEGMTAAFRRPTARTALPGLYLAGGGAHPGAGVPMATLSARHAVEAIMQDRASTSKSSRMATPGGISTGSAPTAGAPFRSSGS